MAENQPDPTDSAPEPATQSQSSAGSSSPKTWGDKKAWLVVAVLILVGGGGYALYQHNKTPAPSKNYPYAKTYTSSNLVDAKLTGTANGRGLSYKKLSTMGTQTDTPVSQALVQLSQSTANKNTYLDVSRLLVTAADFSDPAGPPAGYVDSLKKVLAGDTNSSDYKSALASLSKFAKSGFPEATITTSLGKAQTFSTANLKTNAWQFDVTATDSSGATPTHKGKLVIAIGKNSYYYFMVTAIAQNWDTNLDAFQQILNSIKIDQ